MAKSKTHVRIEEKDQVYYLFGVIDFTTAPCWLQETKSLFEHVNQNIALNLANISKVNSAGMALCIEWLRLAKHYSCKLTIHACPESLLHLARASGLYEMLKEVVVV